ncbi:Aste57867_16842 [Aphanomyces stellatus]|uniref:Aste57867_16842 protein n=1 Tax=Aphanomyces stellatus TaxID=120398 RepID=A0A485L6H7_9STRA|nr:hypothetical protein As57867_016784 [Aphanomyces stellatus]VFT93606.1 Aste57867_16842 [Aphanomyces stellatus]
MVQPPSALAHAVPAAAGAMAIGTLLSSIRARRLKSPSTLFVALGTGAGLFRFINHLRENGNSKLAAYLASLAFYGLCADNHRLIVFSYASIEALLQVYDDHRFLPTLLEHVAAFAATVRVGYTYLMHADWLPPSTVKLFDYQANIPSEHLVAFRRNLHVPSQSRCHTLHPEQSCRAFLTAGTLGLVQRSVQVFLPLQGLSVLANVLLKPHATVHWPKIVDQFARSIAFLTVAYMAPLSCSCAMPHFPHKPVALFAATIPYIALLVEPPKRRASVLKAIAAWALVTVLGQVKAIVAQHGVRRGARWRAMGALVYAMCMTRILQHPERQNPLAMQYLYGRSMKRRKPSTTSPTSQHDAAEGVDMAKEVAQPPL